MGILFRTLPEWEEEMKYRSFKEARKFARSLKLITHEDWKKYAKSGKKPANIPATPNNVYKNKGWVSWPDFLGYEPKRKKK